MDSGSEYKRTSVQSKICGWVTKEGQYMANEKQKYHSDNADCERPASRRTTFLQPSMAENAFSLNLSHVGFKCRTIAELVY